jgi:uncharacterized protein
MPSSSAALRLLLTAALGGIWLASATLHAQQPIPPLTGRVTDPTGTLTATDREALEQKLAAFEARKGSQIVVLMVPTTAPEAIEQYALRVAETWQIGRGEIDDGIVLVIAKDDRRLRIEVGYGLEGAIPDASARRIIDERIVPRFYVEDYAGGVAAGLDALIALIDGEPLPPLTDATGSESAWGALPVILLIALFVAPILRGIFGTLFGSLAVGTGAGIVAWLLVGGLGAALLIGGVVFVFALAGIFGRPGRWASGGMPWGGPMRGGFGGGFRGGGGRFGGGGASGGW